MKKFWKYLAACALFASSTISSIASAQEDASASLPALPRNPAQWVNSTPLSYEQLRGKAIYFVFFEESCPRCRAAWPEIVAAAKANERLPVIFIAVNSGTQRAEVERYARDVKIPWPIIVDTDRNFEKAWANYTVGEISLQNIRQVRGVDASGKVQSLAFDEYPMAIQGLAEGASWKVERLEIPNELLPVWQQVEFGNYTGLGPMLKKASISNRPEVKSAAEKLQAVIETEQQELEGEAVTEAESGNKFKAYEILAKLNEQFKGYPLKDAATKLKKDLPRDAQVKAGIAATKQLANIERQLLNAKPALKEKLGEQLSKIITDFPNTDLSNNAQQLMDTAGIVAPTKGFGGDEKIPEIKSGKF